MLVTYGGPTHPDAEMSRSNMVRKFELDWITAQGSQLVQQRNDLVARFLTQDHEWALLIDDDMVFEPDLLARLASHASVERPIVAALTVAFDHANRRLIPTLYAKGENGVVAHVVAWEPNTVVEVERTGAACVLIHRSVFEKVRDAGFSVERPWFDLGDSGTFGGSGEDIEFFRRVRELGIPILVDTSTHVDHLKTVRFKVTDYVTQLAKESV